MPSRTKWAVQLRWKSDLGAGRGLGEAGNGADTGVILGLNGPHSDIP